MSRLLVLTLMLVSLPAFASKLTGFTAEYQVYYGDYNLGAGRYTLAHTQGDEYKFSFHSKMRFLLMFSDKRWVESDFLYQNDQVLPIRYQHKREGTGPDYFDKIVFDVSANQIRSVHKKDEYKLDYDDLVRDGLSVQLQLMLDLRRGMKRPKYKILDENKLREREFSYVKDEILTIEGKQYDCVMYQVVRSSKKRKTQMWFSKDHDYQPVMMAHYSKDKKRFNARIVSFKEDKPTAVANIALQEEQPPEQKKAL